MQFNRASVRPKCITRWENPNIEIRNPKQYRNANFQNSKQKHHDTTISRKFSKSPGYIRKIPLNPPLQKGEAVEIPALIEMLPFLVLVIDIFVICICFEFRYSNFGFPRHPQMGETYELI